MQGRKARIEIVTGGRDVPFPPVDESIHCYAVRQTRQPLTPFSVTCCVVNFFPRFTPW